MARRRKPILGHFESPGSSVYPATLPGLLEEAVGDLARQPAEQLRAVVIHFTDLETGLDYEAEIRRAPPSDTPDGKETDR